jgi:hypothetical protein
MSVPDAREAPMNQARVETTFEADGAKVGIDSK